jgi:hypothetical protein
MNFSAVNGGTPAQCWGQAMRLLLADLKAAALCTKTAYLTCTLTNVKGGA